jgi:ketosteroid isomerase-like protein
MSQENVDVVQGVLEAWQRDDLDAWLSMIDPAVEWRAVLQRLVEGPEAVYRGHEGMRTFWHACRTELENFEIAVQQVLDVGDDRVLVLGRGGFRGRASGADVESPFGLVVTVIDRKVVRSVDYLSHQEALDATGLAE